MTKLPISVIILTYNEEENLAQCLQSVADWAGEVFVVDSGSTDRTLEIAELFAARVVSHPFENYSQQRNWALDNLRPHYEWVFNIDADERVTPELAAQMERLFSDNEIQNIAGIVVSRRTVFLGRPILHGGHYPVYHLRLFRLGAGRCEDRLYDQHFIVNGPVRHISGDLVDVITSDLTEWLVRHARWGAAEARELTMHSDCLPDGRRLSGSLTGTPIQRRRWLRSSLYGKAPLFWRAFGYFLYRYILRLGFLDGREGLIFHFLQGCCFRFYVDAKIYEQLRLARLDGRVTSDARLRPAATPRATCEKLAWMSRVADPAQPRGNL
jgi:glycosyltransferase involved in cell wall biosynthesis